MNFYAASAGAGGGGGGGGEEEEPYIGAWIPIPVSDGLDYYVADDGNDSNNGLSPAAPKLTLVAGMALLRTGTADRLLLKCGDTWTDQSIYIKASGKSASEPLVIATYGTGDRPIVKGNSGFIRSGGGGSPAQIDNIFVNGIDFYAYKRDPDDPAFDPLLITTGMSMVGDMRNFVIQDCVVRWHTVNIACQRSNGTYAENITFNRNIIVDAWGRDAAPASHSQGIYAELIDGLTVTENIFDHNGWNDDVGAVAKKTIFNHNMYLDSECTDVTVKGNISCYGASHGLQLRPGGVCDSNFFYGNSLAMFSAGDNGIVSEVTKNVIMESGDISVVLTRGFGIEFFRQVGGDLYQGNVIINRASANQVGGMRYNSSTPVALPNTIVRDNVIYNWKTAGGASIELPVATASEFTLTGNIYDGKDQNGNPVAMVDATRNVESYMSSIGESGNIDDFLMACRSRGLGIWNALYSAGGMVDYIKAGYKVV